jgi:hypothetical protein
MCERGGWRFLEQFVVLLFPLLPRLFLLAPNFQAGTTQYGLLGPPEKFTTLSLSLVSIRRAEGSSARGAVALSAFWEPASPGDVSHADCYAQT